MRFEDALQLSNDAIRLATPRAVKSGRNLHPQPLGAVGAGAGAFAPESLADDGGDSGGGGGEPAQAEPNVGYGPSRAKGEWCIAIRAWTKGDLDHPATQWLLERAKSEIDIQITGVIRAGAPASRRGSMGRPVAAGPERYRRVCRPLRAGYSVGHHRITAGTLGAWVERTTDGALLMLSNNHVLADVNGGKKGDVIVQPGSLDDPRGKGGNVGTLEAFVRLVRRGNVADAAVARVDPEFAPQDYTLPRLGAVKGSYVAPAHELADLIVRKVGRQSALRNGRVQSVVSNLAVEFDTAQGRKTFRFDQVLEVAPGAKGPLGEHGDSGALVLDGDNYAVGLLFAGDGTRTYLNPIQSVLEALKLELVKP